VLFLLQLLPGCLAATAGSPTAWQAAPYQSQPLQPEHPTRLPDIDTLQLSAAGGGAGGTAAEGGGGRGLGSYPIVPAPSAEESWLAGLAVPPGASVNIPSAPPRT